MSTVRAAKISTGLEALAVATDEARDRVALDAINAAQDALFAERSSQTARHAAGDDEDYHVIDLETGDSSPTGIPGAAYSALLAGNALALITPDTHELYVDRRAEPGGEFEFASDPMFGTLVEAVEHARTLSGTKVIFVRPGAHRLLDGDTIEGLTIEDIHIHLLDASDFGKTISDRRLISWAISEAWEVITPFPDGDGNPSSAILKWPDGSPGVFAVIVLNEKEGAADSYGVYHEWSNKVVEQPPVTRDVDGNITHKPAMIVATL